MRRKGCIIGILGPDGVGKSTLITDLSSHLQTLGIPVDRHHWRVRWQASSCINAPIVTDPHRQPRYGLLLSLGKLGYYLLSAWPAWLRWIIPKRRAGHWILIDRPTDDLLHDANRYRYGGPRWAAFIWASLMPKPDYVIVLSAPAPVILARKQEIESSVLTTLLASYQSAHGARYHHINVDAPPAVVLRRVLALLEQLAHLSTDHHE
jgi:thymidylate kinase